MDQHSENPLKNPALGKTEILSNDERFRKAMEAAPLAMLKVNQRGIIQFANQSALMLFGYAEQELLNRPVEMLIPEEFRQKHGDYRVDFSKHPNNRRMAKGRELYGQHKDGSLIFLQIGLTPLQIDEDHQILVTIHDITDQKRFLKAQTELNAEREERIKESERQRKAALKLAQDAERARLRAEAAEQRLAAVATELALFKAPENKDIIKHSLSAFHLKDMMICGNQIRSLISKTKSLDEVAEEITRFFELRFKNSDGGNEFSCVRFFRTQAFGQLSYDQMSFIRKTNAQVSQKEICLTLCASRGEPLTDVDHSSTIDSLLHELDSHFATPFFPRAEVESMPLVEHMLNHLYQRNQPDKKLAPEVWHVESDSPDYLTLMSPFPSEAPIAHSTGTTIGLGGKLIGDQAFLLVAWSKTPIKPETFKLLSHLNLSIKLALLPLMKHKDRTVEQIKTVHRLLERKQNLVIHQEARLRDTMKQLRLTNAELDQFAYVASHDLQAPLHGISNLADFLLEDLQDSIPEASRQDLIMLKSRTGRMKNLLNDLLEYARVGHQNPNYEDLFLSEVITHVIALFDIPASFAIHVPEDLPTIRGPRIIFELLFRNLIGNAVKHHDRDDGKIEITYAESNGMHELGVKDDGPGIDPQYHKQAFKVFNTLKPRDQVEGSGMGLAIVEKTVRHYGGDIQLDSAAGKGSHFKFTWPMTLA